MAVTNGYATLAEVREHFADPGTKLDAELVERALNATSRAIDAFCGRRFWLDAAAVTRTYRPDDPGEAWVDDIGTTSGLVIKTDTAGDGSWATTWETGDYQLEPLNADVAWDYSNGGSAAYAWWRIVAVDDKTFPSPSRRATLQVTARFGWSAVPVAVNAACILKAAALFKRRDSPLGIAGFGGFGPVRISRQMDPDVAELLAPYVRVHVGGV